MLTKEKRKEIVNAYRNGELKQLGKGAYSVPLRFFVLGITPSMVNRVMRKFKGGDTDEVS